jgi:death-on-curing family protein
MPNLHTLETSDILLIHQHLTEEFAGTEDPISPPGVKDENLLESAVFRQHTGSGNILKYPTPYSNAAALTYGICCNHAFYNGNKRTALVAMLVHLDRNGLMVMPGTTHNDLFNLILDIANHSFVQSQSSKRRRRDKIVKAAADEEMEAITQWVSKRFRPIVRGEKPISYGRLRRILNSRGFHFEDQRENSVSIFRYVEVEKGFLWKKRIERVSKFVYRFPFSGDTATVPPRVIKEVRKHCSLREEDGVDTSAFYNEEAVIDSIINQYRTLLRRLARR